MSEMTWQHVLYSVESGVAHVVLNRPEKLNALGMGPGSNRVELVEALEQADAAPAVGAILVSARGRAFCAGGDMVGVPRIRSPFDNKIFVDELDALHTRVRAVRKPIVAAVHGLVLGSGLGLTALFDFVIAAEGTRFGLIEGRVGHPGATEIVPLVGAAWAKYLMLTGEIIDARRAAAIGLVLEVEDPDELIARCTDLAERLARMPREAVMLNKASIDSVLEAAGRGAGRSVGRLHDVLTRSMTHAAAAPDGRTFEEILARDGMQSLKAARDTRYAQPWLRPLATAGPASDAPDAASRPDPG
jgi:enoyl-CoA hydratase/carnithine racemase